MQGIDSDLIRGHIDTIILKTLFEGDKYGYEICKEVEEKSGGTYELKQPTLYSCLKRLENQGLISSYWTDSDIGGKRHYYKLTDQGKETYRQNQEEWQRSRQIIDNLISNSYDEASSYSLIKTQELEKLAQAKNEEEHPSTPVNFETVEEQDIIPWALPTKEEQAEEPKEAPIPPESNFEEDSVEQPQIVETYAQNGELISVEQVEETTSNDDEELSPAQSSIFTNDESLVFEEDDANEEGLDILELLGHTIIKKQDPVQVKTQEEVKKEKSEEEKDSDDDQDEAEQTKSPFSFNMDDFMKKSQASYFESTEDTKTDYIAPQEKIEGLKQEETNISEFTFNSQENVPQSEELQNVLDEQEQIYSAPVYHEFGRIEKKQEEEVWVDDSEFDPDQIYLNPEIENEKTAIEKEPLKLFSDDLFEDNDLELEEVIEKEVKEEIVDTEEIKNTIEKKQEKSQLQMYPAEALGFYKATENYSNLSPKYTEEEYKEKLTSLMNYSNKSNAQEKKHEFNFTKDDSNYDDLKRDFDKEGLSVRVHQKMVKESRNTRSYIQSNKINLISSWTSFGIISFITLLTYLIMDNYRGALESFGFSYKYFLIGLAIIAIIPVIYTIIFVINPYKKKTAKFASRMYTLFAMLLTCQLLIIVYCVNLQLGFYSFAQPNYNHLYWIVPSLLSLYPIVDAIIHTIYFNSKNFHI